MRRTNVDPEDMKCLPATLLLILVFVTVGCSGGAASKKRTEELRSAIEALTPTGSDVSPINISHCFSEPRSDPPSCGIVNYFFPRDYDFYTRRDILRGAIERNGSTLVATTEQPDRLFAGYYFKREAYVLHLLVIDDDRRQRCTYLGLDQDGNYQSRSCFDQVSIYDRSPVGLDVVLN